ncbi:hypothetical protein [Streptomonospora salina]|uniref:Ferritin-like metal-binding protein YciE n=1 Tax=Streptomonospora salina TaxID=104205 RepID=A0A841E4X0_9ACTN|nr:hypothetical protein [Streptomonospora salina]MBB5998066.1 ferritin-like metal-binding protein YciE [Streptomonospora salina]
MDALMRHDVLANPHVSEREIFRMLDRIQRENEERRLGDVERELEENRKHLNGATDVFEWQVRKYYHMDLCALRRRLLDSERSVRSQRIP